MPRKEDNTALEMFTAGGLAGSYPFLNSKDDSIK